MAILLAKERIHHPLPWSPHGAALATMAGSMSSTTLNGRRVNGSSQRPAVGQSAPAKEPVVQVPPDTLESLLEGSDEFEAKPTAAIAGKRWSSRICR